MHMTSAFSVKPGRAVRLRDYDPDSTGDIRDKQTAKEVLKRSKRRLFELHDLLYAANKYAVLIVLQSMDASGKDGAIRHVMSGVNPQGCTVTAFKVPSPEEADHDFLWRIHKAVPGRGDMGIFNRSHYEEVLVVRVHKLVPKSVWSNRYDDMNAFEKMLSRNDVKILKFFLHISKDEQKKRLEARLRDPSKNWKFSTADIAERKYWDDYMKAYEDALSRCSTPWAPWFVIPSNNKWFRNCAVSQIIVEAMESLKLFYPKPSFDPAKIKIL